MGWSYSQLMELPQDYLDVLERWMTERAKERARAARQAAADARRRRR